MEKFEHGHLKQMAKDVGISPQFLNNCLRGRRKLKHSIASLLVEVATRYGYVTTVFDWAYPMESDNTLFAKYQGGK